MIFGRKRKQEPIDEVDDTSSSVLPSGDQVTEDQATDELAEEVMDDDGAPPADSDSADDGEPADADEADDSAVLADLRADGPFDIDEVDLDADDIERLDFGSVIITPFEGMQMQLQLDQETNQVHSALVMVEQSALELALFAAPLKSSMVAEIVDEVVAATAAAEGESEVNEGPFGPDVKRVVAVQTDDDQQAFHVSRTWYAQGPRWLLRGTMMGQAALETDFESPEAELLLEVFRNTVVRRGQEPKVPGDLIAMVIPESMVPAADLDPEALSDPEAGTDPEGDSNSGAEGRG